MDIVLGIIKGIFIICVSITITFALILLYGTIIDTNKKITEIHRVIVQQDTTMVSSLGNDTVNVTVKFTK